MRPAPTRVGRQAEPGGPSSASRSRDHSPFGGSGSRKESTQANTTPFGRWFSPLKGGLDAFIDDTQKYVSGEVRLTGG